MTYTPEQLAALSAPVSVKGCLATTVRRITGELRWWCDTHARLLIECNPEAEPMAWPDPVKGDGVLPLAQPGSSDDPPPAPAREGERPA